MCPYYTNPWELRIFCIVYASAGIFQVNLWPSLSLGGGFKHFLFSPLLGEMIQFD